METQTIGVFAAVSVSKSMNNKEYSLTVMQRPGGPDDPYGGYEEVSSEHVPRGLDPEDVVTPDGVIAYDDWEDAQTYWSEDDGGPWEVREENGAYVIEQWEPRE